MRVLAGRGGELAAPFGPICDDDDCACHHGLAGLDSRCPIETITVANLPDLTLQQLTAACADFLAGAGWDDEGGEYSAFMAGEAAQIAARFPVGTRLRASFDYTACDWTFTKQQE